MLRIVSTLVVFMCFLMSEASVKAGTTFLIDNFLVDRNGGVFFNDPFDDGVPPPSAPDLLVGTNRAISYGVSDGESFVEINGKVELNPDLGTDTFTPTGRPAKNHGPRLLTSTNPLSPRNLGPGSTFVVSGVFDLTMPGPLAESFNVGISDRNQPQGPSDPTNDNVVVRFDRSDRDRPTCRDPQTNVEVGAAKGEVVIRLINPDFALDRTTTLDCFKIDLTGGPDQIRLSLGKLDPASNEVAGWFTSLKGGVALTTTMFNATQEIFRGGVFPDGTPFPAEEFTRPNFNAFFIPGVPAPNLVAQVTTDGPVSLSQTVTTPSSPFTLQFDYQYGTTTGNLTVSLGGVTLGVIPAPTGLDTNFQTVIVQVDDPALLGQTLTLQFLLDGILGSTVYLDNILMPGLINGDFQTGNLTVWNTSGVGPVGVSQVASPVALDIHPGSCPNPIKTSSGGVIPMSFLGTRDLDITNIDTTTIRLAGIAPIRTFIEDISTPFEPYVNRESAFDCNRLGPDGFNDLTIKFNTQQVVNVMGPVNNGDLLVLTVTAELFDGTPIRGEDVVVINTK